MRRHQALARAQTQPSEPPTSPDSGVAQPEHDTRRWQTWAGNAAQLAGVAATSVFIGSLAPGLVPATLVALVGIATGTSMVFLKSSAP